MSLTLIAFISEALFMKDQIALLGFFKPAQSATCLAIKRSSKSLRPMKTSSSLPAKLKVVINQLVSINPHYRETTNKEETS